MSEALKALMESQSQNDEEGVTISVSRQALHEVAGEYESLRASLRASEEKLAVAESIIRDGIKLWGPTVQTVVGEMWIKAASSALISNPARKDVTEKP